MEDRYREHIRKNIGELIRQTKYQDLINECEQRRLISSVMRSRIENMPDAEEDEKHKDLFLKITKRGPTAYDELINILMNLKFIKAATLLRAPKRDECQYISMNERPATTNPITTAEPTITYTSKNCVPEGCYPSKDSVDSPHKLVPFTNKIQLPHPFEVKKSKVIHYDRQVQVYPMKSKNRGVFFMVNIIDFPKSEKKKRSGAEVDGKYLLCLFQELGFTCFAYDNLTKKEFFDLLTELRSSEYLAQTECFVLTLMSHGEMVDDMHDRVEFYGGSIGKVNEIEDFFSNEECISLRDKPKLLIFPFCRGEAPDKGVHRLEADGLGLMEPLVNRKMATRSDMLVCYASVRGFQAMRDPDEGSWYIQAFWRVLAKHAHDTHMEDMLKLIGDMMKSLRTPKGYLQTPAFYNHGFNKLLFFNPGVVESN